MSTTKSKVRDVYEALKQGGELEELFPEFTGVWEKDKEEFEIVFEENQSLLN